jgi:hypothetical protein
MVASWSVGSKPERSRSRDVMRTAFPVNEFAKEINGSYDLCKIQIRYEQSAYQV